MARGRSQFTGGSYNQGRTDAGLSPTDIPRPEVSRDPGVTMRPSAVLLGNPEDPRGVALDRSARAVGAAQDAMAIAMRGFSRDMAAVGTAFAALAKQRQDSEDAIAVDRGQLMLAQEFEPIVQKKLSSPDTSNPEFLRQLDEELAQTQQKVRANMTEQGYALSPDGERKFDHAAMSLRVGAARRASVEVNNQRVALITQRADDNVQDIARMAGSTGDVTGAMTRLDSTLEALRPVLSPSAFTGVREKAHTLVLESTIDGHIRRGRVDKAQELVDRFTGFVQPDAGEVPKVIADAARARGVDPAVAIAIAKTESDLKPDAANPNSSARGLFQFTNDTARRLGLPTDVPLPRARPVSEDEFQRGIRATEWFKEYVKEHGEEPDLDTKDYDYRGAWAAGARPTVRDAADNNRLHWPSQFKGDNHPNRFVGGVDTKTGNTVPAQWTVEQQAAAGAALTADNIAALRRNLGSEPTPTDVYLAHFLGAPTAVQVLRGEPGAKLADVLTPEALAANATIRHKGKAFSEMDVGELYAWAQSRIATALKDTNGLIDGRTVKAGDAAVPIKAAMTLGHKVHNAATAERSRLRVVIKDDIASIRHTGVGVEIDQVAAAAILPPGEMVTWREDRETARAYFDATNDMASQLNAEVTRRVEMLNPDPGAPGYARKLKLFREVERVANDLFALRGADPAGSVDDDGAVTEAKKAYNPQDPATLLPVIKARLAAQDKIGIPEARRSPITLEEAKALSEPLRTMLPGQERAALTEVATTARSMFGEYADEAFAFALHANKIGRANTVLAMQVAKRLRLGQPVGADDLDAAAEADAWAEVSSADRATYAKIAQTEMLPEQRYYDPSAAATFDSQPGEPGVNAPARAIALLRADPSTADAFDAKYGNGVAKKILDKYPVR